LSTPPVQTPDRRYEGWLTPGVRGIGAASLLADAGHEIPTSLLPTFLTSTLGAPASALGLIEGVSDGLAGAARLGGGALADDPQRRRVTAVGGYASTAVLSALTGVASTAWQAGVLRAGAWASRGLRVPSRNARLADTVPAPAYGRAYGFERAIENLGAIVGPLLALGLVGLVGVRTAILLSVIPGLFAVAAIVYAIRHTARPKQQERQPIRLRLRPVMRGELGRLLGAIGIFELGNIAATLLILRATDLLEPGRSTDSAAQIAIALYLLYNVAASLTSVPAGRLADLRTPEARARWRRRRLRARVHQLRLYRRRQHPHPRRLLHRCGHRHRRRRNRRTLRRRRARNGGPPRLQLRCARRHPELRQPRRQQHRRAALRLRLSDRRVPLPGRRDAAGLRSAPSRPGST
jgi:Major Facilitator Superfamily